MHSTPEDDSVIIRPNHAEKIASEGEQDTQEVLMFDKTAYDEPGANPLDKVNPDLHRPKG